MSVRREYSTAFPDLGFLEGMVTFTETEVLEVTVITGEAAVGSFSRRWSVH